jgi:hypothetical protein
MNKSKRPVSPCIRALLFSCMLLIFLNANRIAYAADTGPVISFLGIREEVELLQKRVREASPGVVSITVYDSSGEKIKHGSGFFIDRDGKIIMNAGILKGVYSAEIKSNSHTYTGMTILAMDEQTDLALVQVGATDETPIEMDFDYRPVPDERVLMVGKTESMEDTVAEGIVISINDNGEIAERIEIKKTIPITYFPEFRDGPVLNGKGKVIAIQAVISEHSIFGKDAILLNDKKVSAIGVKAIYALLSDQSSAVELPQAGSKLWSAWIKKQISNAFVMLYETGFSKLVGFLLLLVAFISLIQWLYTKIRKSIKGRG